MATKWTGENVAVAGFMGLIFGFMLGAAALAYYIQQGWATQ